MVSSVSNMMEQLIPRPVAIAYAKREQIEDLRFREILKHYLGEPNTKLDQTEVEQQVSENALRAEKILQSGGASLLIKAIEQVYTRQRSVRQLTPLFAAFGQGNDTPVEILEQVARPMADVLIETILKPVLRRSTEAISIQCAVAERISAETGTSVQDIFENEALYRDMIIANYTVGEFVSPLLQTAKNYTTRNFGAALFSNVRGLMTIANGVNITASDISDADIEQTRKLLRAAPKIQDVLNQTTLAQRLAWRMYSADYIRRFWGNDALQSLSPDLLSELTNTD